MKRVIDFHVLMALVLYIERPEAAAGDWGCTDVKGVRTQICKLRDKHDNVDWALLSQWLAETYSNKPGALTNRRDTQLRELVWKVFKRQKEST